MRHVKHSLGHSMSHQYDILGGFMLVADSVTGSARISENKAADREDERRREEDRKNNNFTQVYPQGWETMKKLAGENPGAFRMYAFLAENIDSSCGAVVCDQTFLSNQFEVTVRTVQRWLNYLEENDCVIRIPVAGRVCAYALNPHQVWKGYNNGKDYAAFVTKTLVNKDGEIQRRIQAMFSAHNDTES